MTFPYVTWVAAIERHHRLIVALSVLVGLLSALSLTRLRLDIDVLNMLPHGATFVGDFGELDQLLVLIQGAPADRLQAFADVSIVLLPLLLRLLPEKDWAR